MHAECISFKIFMHKYVIAVLIIHEVMCAGICTYIYNQICKKCVFSPTIPKKVISVLSVHIVNNSSLDLSLGYTEYLACVRQH